MFCLPLSGLVPTVGEGGLLGYSLLGERVGFYGYFPQRCWFWLLPKEERRKRNYIYSYIYIYRIRSKEQNKRDIRGLKKKK